MRPELTDQQLADLPSQAEADFYRACRRQLPDSCLVLHSLSWVVPDASGTPRDGEADFVIFDPKAGVLVVEVKGGGVVADPRDEDWTSVDGRGIRHWIKNPFKQVVGEKYAVLDQLRSHDAWRRIGSPRVVLGHAVFLPDVDEVDRLVNPQRPRELIGGRADLSRVDLWVARAYRFWAGADARSVPLGADGMRAIERIFCEPIEVRPVVSVRLRHEEERRIRLTSQQAKLLRSLGPRPRAAICGGAGTGKTVLAFQKAREVAAAGMETLFLCYNRPLADHLQEMVGQTPRLRAMSFHQLCDWRARVVKARGGRDLLAEARRDYPNGDHFEQLLPHALCLSCEDVDEQYDAIIVDEAQDFSDAYWLPIELLLRDPDRSLLYVFYDQNQAVYRRTRAYPVKEAPFVLSVNCRNTRCIHEAAYRFFHGDPTDPCEIDGVPVETVPADGVPRQAAEIGRRVADLLTRGRVAARDVVVLVGGDPPDLYFDQIQRVALPNGVRWGVRQPRAASRVAVETVNRFKGLEAGIAFLWGVEDLDPDRDRESIYVGTSRAKSQLFLVGSGEACERVLAGMPGD